MNRALSDNDCRGGVFRPNDCDLGEPSLYGVFADATLPIAAQIAVLTVLVEYERVTPVTAAWAHHVAAALAARSWGDCHVLYRAIH